MACATNSFSNAVAPRSPFMGLLSPVSAAFDWRQARRTAVASLVAFALVKIVSNAEANMIVNGSFESGNTGFSSDYTYWPPLSPSNMGASTYSVIQSLSQVHAVWATNGSLSAQSGTNYFVGNGSSNNTLSPWMQTITVNPGSITTSSSNAPVYYRFQAYVASVFASGGAAQPELSFEMSLNNSGVWQELTSSSAPPSPFNWYLTYADGYFGFMPTNISFRLRNEVTASTGNDFAVDSIYFGLSTNAPAYNPLSTPINSVGEITGGATPPAPVPEPGTWAAAILLLGAACCVYWRRRTAL